jgi:hypothetical protein
MKILISVLSLNREPYIGLEKTIRETWASERHKDVEVIYYYGDSNEIKLTDDRLFLDTPEGLMNIGYKTLKMYEYILENYEFDYLFRTNSSSYVNIEKLKEFIRDKPNEKFYSGTEGKYNGVPFASGSGYFLSKDNVEFVLEHRNEWDHTLIDDVSLGKLLTNRGIKIMGGKRLDIVNTLHIDLNHYHYRVKNKGDRRVDSERMYNIYKQLHNQ